MSVMRAKTSASHCWEWHLWGKRLLVGWKNYQIIKKNIMLQELPIGIQSFADLRSKGYLYVDKTQVIHRLITSGKP
ncbi:AAA family ATPase, partial [Candidatus Symbiothrix dinenymphae]|uniref:AAA family ATPase n=1 Tax=Candidatus Symbiothrix dinenymphae TaxID=467085 RepID=UPI00277D1055